MVLCTILLKYIVQFTVIGVLLTIIRMTSLT